MLLGEIMANQIISHDGTEDENQLVISDSDNNKRIQFRGVVIVISLIIILLICVCFLTIYSVINYTDKKIKKGVFIEGIDVSGLTLDDAKNKVQTEFLDKLENTIYFQYGENLYSLALEQINAKYKLDDAVQKAYNVGRDGSLITRDITVFKLPKNPVNVTIDVTFDEEALEDCISDISAKLPEQVTQPSYYIEDGELIITSGKIGKAASNEETKGIVIDALKNKRYKDVYYDIPTYDKYPEKIDVDKIYNEIYREMKNAYFTVEPRMVYADVTGIDFRDSVDDVKAQIEREKKDEYNVALKYTRADVTVNDLGQDAFPDELGSFVTKYSNNANRTTNLRLASNKINGTVIMPGDTFSYNKIVGERTIAAGYKNASVFENGRIVDGLGGGICQVSTTLYNAVLYANLQIVERTNHMFLAGYADGGRDATVAYGSLDFRFKNNRTYPIKIESRVENGYCTVKVYGLRMENDFDVEIVSNKIGPLKYQAFRRLYQNGVLVGTEELSVDTYSSPN